MRSWEGTSKKTKRSNENPMTTFQLPKNKISQEETRGWTFCPFWRFFRGKVYKILEHFLAKVLRIYRGVPNFTFGWHNSQIDLSLRSSLTLQLWLSFADILTVISEWQCTNVISMLHFWPFGEVGCFHIRVLSLGIASHVKTDGSWNFTFHCQIYFSTRVASHLLHN